VSAAEEFFLPLLLGKLDFIMNFVKSGPPPKYEMKSFSFFLPLTYNIKINSGVFQIK